MNITFIGSGNTAFALASLFTKAGHFIVENISRNIIEGEKFAALYGCKHIQFHQKPNQNTDIVIICLSDNSFPEAIKDFCFNNKVVVHTAGSCTINLLAHISTNYGVLYPLQSLRKELDANASIPFLIEANNKETLDFIKQFAQTASNTVVEQNSDERLRMHVAAVFVNNFTNYLYTVTEKYCANEKVDFNFLKPLIKETAIRVQAHSPLSVQTGPAVRGDITTLDKHLRLLTEYPKLRTLYMRMTDGIMNG